MRKGKLISNIKDTPVSLLSSLCGLCKHWLFIQSGLLPHPPSVTHSSSLLICIHSSAPSTYLSSVCHLSFNSRTSSIIHHVIYPPSIHSFIHTPSSHLPSIHPSSTCIHPFIVHPPPITYHPSIPLLPICPLIPPSTKYFPGTLRTAWSLRGTVVTSRGQLRDSWQPPHVMVPRPGERAVWQRC